MGGNAASFVLGGQCVDFGSHRLHPACDPVILQDIRTFLGADLRDRCRHGRIRLRGRWVRFPLKPLDLLMKLDGAFLAGAMRDAVVRFGRRPPEHDQSFREALLARLGPTICSAFYFPYALKIWGLEPEAMAAEQAQRRVAANSPGKLVQKVLAQVEGYAAAAREAGAELSLGWSAKEIVPPASGDDPWTVVAERSEERTLRADHVWSTIPLTLLARITRPDPPPEVLEAASSLDYRAMLLVYLVLPVGRFTEFDAHYFPGSDVSITRLSESKTYSGVLEPQGQIVLCAELPCSPEDVVWTMRDEELGRIVLRDLEQAGLPLVQPPSGVHVRRLRHAYPIYTRDFGDSFTTMDRWASTLPRFLSFGRQGLFAHDNTHHALAMAYAAAECLGPEGFDGDNWAGYRREFEKHVVVD